LLLFGCMTSRVFTGTKTFFLAAMSHLLGPMPASMVYHSGWKAGRVKHPG